MPNGMDYSLKNRVIDGTGMILDTEPGTPDDVGTYVTESQLADWIKGKILFTGYYHNGNFYSDSGHTTLLAKVNGALYIDQTNANKALYVCLSSTYQSLTEEAQVQAIIDGLNDGTIVPLKATQDSLGNQIDTTYATKADLQDGTLEPLISTKSRQDQNGNVIDQTYETKADASDLKDAISALQKQIDNITEAEDLLSDVDYANGDNAVPANVSEYAEVSVLKGVGRIANNLQYNGNFASADGWISGTVSDGHIEGSANANTYWQPFNSNNKPTIIQGHVYYIRAKLTAISGLASGTTTYNLRINGQSSTNNAVSMLSTSIPNGTSVMLEGLHTANASTSGTGVRLYWGVHNDTNNFTAQWEGLVITDLTIYFNGTIPTNAQTIAQIQQNYPELLIPSDYDTEAVFPTYTAIKSVGRNLAQANPTYYDSQYIPAFDADKCYKVTAGVTYYWKIFEKSFNTWRARIFFYDMEGNPLTTPSTSWVTEVSRNGFYVNGQGLLWGGNGSDTTKKWTFSQNFYIRFCFILGDTTSSSVISKFCFNVSDADDGTFTEYFEDTLTLPTPVTLKRAGDVAEEYYPESGRMTHPISTHNLGNMSYTYAGVYGSATNVFTGFMEGKRINSSTLANALCEACIVVTNNYLYSHDVACISFADASPYLCFRINDPTFTRQSGESDADYVARFKEHLADKMLYMERATPSADTYVDPIPDNYIKVEPNGTIETVQSQSPKVDGAMTVTYTNKVSA